MSSSEYIVATALKPRTKIGGKRIEELVQRRSRIESYGNAVFTMMLLRRFESKSDITASFVCQAAIGACMRSVCVRKRNERPSAVEFKCADVQTCMRVSQQEVTQRMNSFDSDEGVCQIMNDAARRYLTIFKNNFSMRMGAWQYRAIIADLRCRQHPAATWDDQKLLTFVARSILRLVSSATPLDPSMYKNDSIRAYVISTDQTCQEIIHKHRAYLGDPIAKLEVKSITLGIMSDTHIQKHVHLFVAYAIWLQRTTQTLNTKALRFGKPDTRQTTRTQSAVSGYSSAHAQGAVHQLWQGADG